MLCITLIAWMTMKSGFLIVYHVAAAVPAPPPPPCGVQRLYQMQVM